MLLKAGIFFLIAAVGGGLSSVLVLIPPEQVIPAVDVAELTAEALKDQFVTVQQEEGKGNFLRWTCDGSSQNSGVGFVTDLQTSPKALLHLDWRARGETEQIRVEVTLKDEGETVLSTTMPAPSEEWVTTRFPLSALSQGEIPPGSAGSENRGDKEEEIKRISFWVSSPSQLELDIRRVSLIQPSLRWKAASAILSAGGLLTLALLAVVLIGRQSRVDQKLARSGSYYRSIFNAVSEGICVLDISSGAVLDVNEQACQIFGSTRTELLKADVAGIVAGTIKRDPLSWIKKALQEQESNFEWRGKSHSGEDLWIEFNLSWTDIDGDRCLLAVVRDISRQKQTEEDRVHLEQQLLHSQKLEAIGQLAGGVAHDFNNILTSISCSTELALRDVQPRSLPAAGFRQISDLTQRATSLTRQLLAFSRQQALRPTSQSLNSLIENAIKMLTRMIGEDVQLIFKPAAEPDTVRADSGQIEQILMNLAINARDAMPEGGTLRIETCNVLVDAGHPADVEPGSFLKLSVTDTGQGMDEETRERSFEPFFTTKEVGKGTGLGLSTVYGIVRQHRGDILFDSQLGEGTVFHIFLPLVNEEVLSLPEVTDDLMPEGSENILLVEDDPNAREIIERVLKAQGYRVHRADSAREARGVFQREGDKIDLILTDIVMPGENGVQLHKQLLEKNPALKVLFMSGYTARGSLQNEVLRPGLPFIPKPFGSHELARKVREVLDASPGFNSNASSTADSVQPNM